MRIAIAWLGLQSRSSLILGVLPEQIPMT